MKTIAQSIFILILLISAAPAFDVTFVWDANPETDKVVGYRLYAQTGDPDGPLKGFEVLQDGITETSVTVDLPAGDHYLTVTAYNEYGLESLPSDVLPLQIDENGKSKDSRRPSRVKGFRVKVKWEWLN